MNISRKDFFKKSFISLGEAVFSVTDALKAASEMSPAIPDVTNFVSVPSDNQQAVARNDNCLAKNSGCFTCVERCASQAIRLIPGVGIRINAYLCTGCGTCEYVCPITPKAVSMKPRTTFQLPSAH